MLIRHQPNMCMSPIEEDKNKTPVGDEYEADDEPPIHDKYKVNDSYDIETKAKFSHDDVICRIERIDRSIIDMKEMMNKMLSEAEAERKEQRQFRKEQREFRQEQRQFTKFVTGFINSYTNNSFNRSYNDTPMSSFYTGDNKLCPGRRAVVAPNYRDNHSVIWGDNRATSACLPKLQDAYFLDTTLEAMPSSTYFEPEQ
ncbi:hypothetical protein WN944_007355 [Citrus x changshan-huyou]|uniref:Uncharacterized protein n=1 Tax=Citrus x changshan-huyou TaxID=2935761 RepID=A0AAP0MS88_9ROSI